MRYLEATKALDELYDIDKVFLKNRTNPTESMYSAVSSFKENILNATSSISKAIVESGIVGLLTAYVNLNATCFKDSFNKNTVGVKTDGQSGGCGSRGRDVKSADTMRDEIDSLKDMVESISVFIKGFNNIKTKRDDKRKEDKSDV